MITRELCPRIFVTLLFLFCTLTPGSTSELLRVIPAPGPQGIQLRLHGEADAGQAISVRLQRSKDLRQWENVGDKVRLAAGQNAQGTALATEDDESAFFRLSSRPDGFIAEDGASALGFAGRFDDELAALGDLSLEQFRDRFASPHFLERLSWDPSVGKYWNLFNDPNRGWKSTSTGSINLGGLALTEAETAVMRRQGFVVPERLSTHSFADAYYQIFERDLPVFVTADSILHAWHRSFDAILEEIETYWVAPVLQLVLDGMADQITAAMATSRPFQRQALEDADYFLGVARSLLAGSTYPTKLATDARVAAALAAIVSEKPQFYTFFDTSDIVDFGAFRPRGHYTKTVQLQRYFRTMSWLGRVDFRVAGASDWASPRQLNAALILSDVLNRSGRAESFAWIENLIRNLIGRADSMGPAEMKAIATAAGLSDLSMLRDSAALTDIQRRLEAGSLGLQLIQGHSYASGGGAGQLKLPRSFALLGQRFTPDSWVMNQVVWDRIRSPITGDDVRRRRSYSLDVAFAALGNS